MASLQLEMEHCHVDNALDAAHASCSEQQAAIAEALERGHPALAVAAGADRGLRLEGTADVQALPSARADGCATVQASSENMQMQFLLPLHCALAAFAISQLC